MLWVMEMFPIIRISLGQNFVRLTSFGGNAMIRGDIKGAEDSMETTAAVLIPAYKPDERMLQLIEALKTLGFSRQIVVDDGNGEDYAPLFERAKAAGAEVLHHPVNQGKGAALKTGLTHILSTQPCPVITVDADGQHDPKDVQRIAEKMAGKPEALVLGVRDKSRMPARSKFGNTLTCWTLGAVSGLWVDDTQILKDGNIVI
jgi:glycosyltransferase involved in cell wall biosynthesis